MRQLKKSAGFDWTYGQAIAHLTNCSTKPHARLMHSLAAIVIGPGPGRSPLYLPMLSNLNSTGPNRAARRAPLHRLTAMSETAAAPLNRLKRRAEKFGRVLSVELNVIPHGVTPEGRKVTGAVRRGLERGRKA